MSAFEVATGARLADRHQGQEGPQHQYRRRPARSIRARCTRSTAWPSWWRWMPPRAPSAGARTPARRRARRPPSRTDGCSSPRSTTGCWRYATQDGRQLWTFQATNAATAVLGQSAPAYADGFVVAGFGSGELATLRARQRHRGLDRQPAAATAGGTLAEFSAIRGLVGDRDGRVFAISVGRQMVALDLPTGRRLWEREVASEDTPWVAGDWIFLTTLTQQLAAIDRTDGRVAWVTDLPRWENEKKQSDPITWFGPVLARRPAGGRRDQPAGLLGQPLHRRRSSASRGCPVPPRLGPVVVDGHPVHRLRRRSADCAALTRAIVSGPWSVVRWRWGCIGTRAWVGADDAAGRGHRGPAECRQVDAVQPPGRAARGAGGRHSGRHARPQGGRGDAARPPRAPGRYRRAGGGRGRDPGRADADARRPRRWRAPTWWCSWSMRAPG